LVSYRLQAGHEYIVLIPEGQLLKLLQKGILVILLPLLLNIGLVAKLVVLNNEAEAANLQLSRSRELITLTDRAWVIIYNMVWQQLAMGVSSDEAKANTLAISKRLEPDLEKLKKLGETYPTQRANIKQFTEWARGISRRILVISNARDEDGLEIPFITIRQLMGELQARTAKLSNIKRAIHEEADKANPELTLKNSQARQSYQIWLFTLIALDLLLALCSIAYFVKNIVNRISMVNDNARRYSHNQPLNKPLSGSDEIAELDKAFREMASAVDAAASRERSMIDNAVDVICSVNEYGTFTAVSPAAERLWGFTPADLIGKPMAEILEPDSQKTAYDELTSIKSSNDTVVLENKIVRRDGCLRDMQWSVQWSESDLKFFCVVHDIGDRKAVERLKQDFINMISHDLKTPLTAVRLTLELVLKGVYGELDAKGQHRITVAQDSTQRLLELVNQLLQLERLEAGKMELNKSPQVVHKLLDMSRDSVQAFAEQHLVKVETQCPTSLRAEVDGDRIVQVLINLLSNAVKFSPAQSVISLTAENTDEQLIVRVIDQGRGVPEHLRESIFDRFKQVERADSDDKGGTGLGLAICQAIVHSHSGEIGVDSVEGRGSTFWFKLPIGDVSRETPEVAANASQ